MALTEKTVELTLSFSNSGVPLFQPKEHAKLAISVEHGVQTAEGHTIVRCVTLSGNRQGLVDLSRAILALAESDDSDYHLHLDNLYAANIHAVQGYWLMVEKMPE